MLLSKFLKFCLVGVINTLIDFGVYSVLTRSFGWYFLTANVVSILIAMTCSFFFNKRWTFDDQNKNVKIQYLKFAGVNLVYFALYNLIFYCLVNYLGVWDMAAKLAATALGLIWNFAANYLWTFKAPTTAKPVGKI